MKKWITNETQKHPNKPNYYTRLEEEKTFVLAKYEDKIKDKIEEEPFITKANTVNDRATFTNYIANDVVPKKTSSIDRNPLVKLGHQMSINDESLDAILFDN